MSQQRFTLLISLVIVQCGLFHVLAFGQGELEGEDGNKKKASVSGGLFPPLIDFPSAPQLYLFCYSII